MKIKNLVFKAGRSAGGDPLTFSPKHITLFIGPNNGGKSRALMDLQHNWAPTGHYDPVIFAAVDTSPISEEEFRDKLQKLERPKLAGENSSPDTIALQGRGGRQIVHLSILKSGLSTSPDVNSRQYAAQHFLRHFFINLDGTGRLQLANPAMAEPIGQNPTTTVSTLFQNDEIRSRLSHVTKAAFNQFLVIDPTQMPNLTYRLSDDEPTGGVEKRLDSESVKFFEDCLPLQDASDGTKAFIGILAEVLAGDPDIIFVDEPEAFLHPSLSYLLGQQIASSAVNEKQVFAATHSSSFLLGCVLSGAKVDVVRLTHRNGNATARLLSSERLAELMVDPLFRSVGATTALFYENAIVVEGDSDRAFYDEINNRLTRTGDCGISHSTILNAHNKQTAVNIVKPLREIGIPTAFIFDIDWLKEDGQVWDRYFSALGAPTGLKESFAAARRSVRGSLEAIDPNYKRNGGINLLSGSERQTAEAFFDQMEEYGLFTVRSGELENWLPNLNVERTKSKWLASIFAAMGSHPNDPGYLHPATDDVWAFMGRIKEWTSNPNRRGM